MSHLCPPHGLVSQHNNLSIGDNMEGTIYLHNEPYDFNLPTLAKPTPSINNHCDQNPPQHLPLPPIFELPLTDDIKDTELLGTTIDSGITPAMYNLWQSFASLFLPQSLALPPQLSPISLLSYSYISHQLQPFDLILIRTPGLAYSAMRRIVEHSYDHVAIVLTHNCALHISPPYTRIIPIASLLSPTRNPVILRPRFTQPTSSPSSSPKPLHSTQSSILPLYKSQSQSTISTSLNSSNTPISSPPASSSNSLTTFQSSPQQKLQQPSLILFHTPTLHQNPSQSQALFLDLLKLLGTPYDSLKMYTLWGKLALNRLINQPITKIDSSGVICTDAIMNILHNYDKLFTLAHVLKQWFILHSHTRLQFNPRSSQAINDSKAINFPIKGILFGPQLHPHPTPPLIITTSPTLINTHHDSTLSYPTTSQYTFNKTTTLLSIPQTLIHHQLPLSNLEMLSFTRLSTWSLNDLLQLSHPHMIYPNPQLYPMHTHSLPILSSHYNNDQYQSPSELPSLPRNSPSRQFEQLAKKPLFIDAAFDILLPPSQPIPITYLYPFCHQLSLMCANFVLRETVSPHLQSTSATTSPDQLIKHDRRHLLKLVNPYYRPLKLQPSQQSQPNKPADFESDETHTLADSLFYYLICRLPGMVPLYLLQSMKLSLESLQRGKKYEIRPQILLYEHPISHPALLTLSSEVNTMFNDIVIQPFHLAMKQIEERRKLKSEQKSNAQPIFHMASQSSQTSQPFTNSSSIDVPIPSYRNSSSQHDDVVGSTIPSLFLNKPTSTLPSTSTATTPASISAPKPFDSTSLSHNSQNSIADRLRGLFIQLTTFGQGLFSPHHVSEINPDGLDPKIQSTIVHNSDLSNDPNQEIKIDETTGSIVQFPQWLKLLVPSDLLHKINDLVNVAVSPIDGYKEYLKTRNKKKINPSIFLNPQNDPQHPFPSIKYLSSIPTPFLLYIWSLLKPILRFYLLLTLLSRFLPYLVYKLTASTLVALMTLPGNTISFLAVNTSTSQIPVPKQKQGLFKRTVSQSSTSKSKFNLITSFRSRFLAFVYAIVAATVLRSVWNSQSFQSHINSSTKMATHSFLSRVTSTLHLGNFGQQDTINSDDCDDCDVDTLLVDPIELDIQQKRLQQLLPSGLLKEAQQIARGQAEQPLMSTTSLSQTSPPSPLLDPNNSLLISPMYSHRFLDAGTASTNTVMSEITTLTRSLLDSYRTFLTPGTATPNNNNNNNNNNPNTTHSFLNFPQSNQATSVINSSPQVQTFLQRSDQSLAWLNEVLKVTFYITTDTLGLRTLSKRVSNSRSMKEIQRQINNIRGQLNNNGPV